MNIVLQGCTVSPGVAQSAGKVMAVLQKPVFSGTGKTHRHRRAIVSAPARLA